MHSLGRLAVGSPICMAIDGLPFWSLLVGVFVERDKEEQVARQETAPEHRCTLRARACARVRKDRDVGRSKVGVACQSNMFSDGDSRTQPQKGEI